MYKLCHDWTVDYWMYFDIRLFFMSWLIKMESDIYVVCDDWSICNWMDSDIRVLYHDWSIDDWRDSDIQVFDWSIN